MSLRHTLSLLSLTLSILPVMGYVFGSFDPLLLPSSVPVEDVFFQRVDKTLQKRLEEANHKYELPERNDDQPAIVQFRLEMFDLLPKEEKEWLMSQLKLLGLPDFFSPDSEEQENSAEFEQLSNQEPCSLQSSTTPLFNSTEWLDVLPEYNTADPCPGMVFFPETTDSGSSQSSKEEGEENDCRTEATNDATANVVTIDLNEISISGKAVETHINGFRQQENSDLKALISLTQRLVARALERQENSETNARLYEEKMTSSEARKDPWLKDIYEAISGLFQIHASINRQLANQLFSLLQYVDSMVSYKISPLGPLNFPLLFRHLGITYTGKQAEQFSTCATIQEEIQILSRFLALLTRNFRHTYKLFTVNDQSTAGKISEWLKNAGLNNILEIGAGLGWMQQALSSHGIQVTATDSFQLLNEETENHLSTFFSRRISLPALIYELLPQNEKSPPTAKVNILIKTSSPPLTLSLSWSMAGEVQQIDWVSAARKYQSSVDALLLANPNHESFLEALNTWGNEKPVIFISVRGIKAFCQAARATCNIQPFSTLAPDLGAWSSMEGYQKMEVFYWHGTE